MSFENGKILSCCPDCGLPFASIDPSTTNDEGSGAVLNVVVSDSLMGTEQLTGSVHVQTFEFCYNLSKRGGQDGESDGTKRLKHAITLDVEQWTRRLHDTQDSLSAFVVWMKNTKIEYVTDPALLAGAKALSIDAGALSNIIGCLFFYLVAKLSICCQHGLLFDRRICTWLVVANTVPSTNKQAAVKNGGREEEDQLSLIGLYNLVDLTLPLLSDRIGVVDAEHFEVAPFEDAVSVKDFCQLKDWVTYNCEEPLKILQRRRWGHLLFLSHAWTAEDVPGTHEELHALQRAVTDYVTEALKRGPTTLVKNFKSEDDFGVWLDYLAIPNDARHKDCPSCKALVNLKIAKLGGLPSTSTTIALHPGGMHRGWILHELTQNSYGNVVDIHGVELRHSDRHHYANRINLMVRKRVEYTNGEDGRFLRCHEFLRLGQMPGFWPQVRWNLCQELLREGITDERSTEATRILFNYTRRCHMPCHALKRAMINLPQELAQRFDPTKNPARSKDGDNSTSTLSWDYSEFESCVTAQEGVMLEKTGLPKTLCEASSHLQRLQFVAVVMGLRAELYHKGGGWLSWVSLSAISAALASCIHAVRLHDGEPKIFRASCTIELSGASASASGSEDDSQRKAASPEIPQATEELIRFGVSEEHLRFVLGFVFPRARRS